MAFADDVVLNNGSTNSTYSIVDMSNGRSIRKVASQPLSEPAVLTISHQISGKGSSAVARRMVRLDRTVEDDTTGETATVSAHIVLTVPNTIIVKNDVSSEVTKLVGFLQASGNLDKLLNGEP